MPTNLTNQAISATYTQLLHVDGGVSGSTKIIYGGNGVATSCKISSGSFTAGNVVIATNTISTNTGDLILSPSGGVGKVTISNVDITGGTIDGVTALTDVGTISVEGGAYTKTETITSAAGVLTANCDDSNVFTTTLTENVTLSLSNADSGQTVNILITQDGTGSRTMSWPASFKWPSGTPSSLSTGAGDVDLLTATFIGSSWYATLIKDFS